MLKNQKIFLNIIFLVLITISIFSCKKIEKQVTKWQVFSPDSSNTINFLLKNDSLFYNVVSNKDTVILNSPLGLVLSDRSFDDSLRCVSVSSINKIETNYELMHGKCSKVSVEANEISAVLENSTKNKITIIARASKDGVAFRYAITENDTVTKTFLSENTTFKMDTTNGKAWLQNFGLTTDWGPAYEDYYNTQPIGQSAKDSSGFSFPMLFKSKNHWILITETNLNESYCGTRIAQNCANGLYKVRYPAAGDGQKTGLVNPVSKMPWMSPWRVIITSDTIANVVQSTMVTDLADPQMAGNFDWVKPGRSSWSWWGEHDSPKDFKRLKAYIDFAKSLGWEYSLIDANWDLMVNGGDIKALCDYAKSQGVGLLFWYNSGGPHNNVTERPRDIMCDATKRKEEFKKIAAWGVKGIKVDFFQSDKQNIIQLYTDILKDAAAAQIMVNFHGCTLPRGWNRTYPNLVSMEAVYGAEQYGWSKTFPPKAAQHNVNLVFTRNIVGPMDYTPTTFSDYKGSEHITSNTHELALPIVFESGITHWADREYEYRKMDKSILNIMSKIPAKWDQTMLINGEPDKQAILARRSGNDWFVAGINGETMVKDLTIKLPFITIDSAKVSLFADGKTSRIIDFSEFTLSQDKSLSIKMASSGGFVAWIRK